MQSSHQPLRTSGFWSAVALMALTVPSASAAKTVIGQATPANGNHAATSVGAPTKPLSPADALRAFRVPADLEVEQVLAEPDVRQPLFVDWDERGRMWVVEYNQYPYPAGLKMISRDEYWRAVYDKVPAPPPHGARGLDRITIHEDTDGDGRYDKHTTFLDGLNIVTSFAVARDGVWVLNPPYLLFYPDRNHDDIPDGDPEVVLQGFGMEDTHSVVNNLQWGPDGWLYACQGSTVSGHVIRTGLDKNPVHSMGQLIWRYQPQTRQYEIFAEGGGNAFGLEIDSKGRIFSGHNGGDTRGFHYVQGGYYQKGFQKHGPLSNPYAFGYFPAMAHSAVPRFTHKFLIYDDVALPEAYRGKFFGVEPLQGRIVYGQIDRDGSSFKTKDLGWPVATSDPWFRPVNLTVSPDGAIYFCDMYEPKISHRDHFAGTISKDTGRIYRLQAKGARHRPPENLGSKSTTELIARLDDPNRWTRRTVLRLLGERKDPAARGPLLKRLSQPEGATALEALWAWHWIGSLDEPTALASPAHPDPDVRLWTARLLCDERAVSSQVAATLVKLSATENNLDVLSQLACSARRLPARDALPVLRNLAGHDAVVSDIHIPLLIWWGIEAKAESDRDAVLALFDDPAFWRRPLVRKFLVERMLERYAAAGGRANLMSCVRLFRQSPDAESTRLLVKGFEQASRGRLLEGLPPELVEILAKVGGNSLPLGVRQGRAEAVAKALGVVADPHSAVKQRLQLIEIFGEVLQPNAVPVLLALAEHDADPRIKTAALASLCLYDEPRIGTAVVALYPHLADDAQSAAETLLSTRKSWSRELLEAVDAGRVDPGRLKPEVVRKMTVHRDPRIAALIARHFPHIKGATTAEMQAQIGRLSGVLKPAAGGDPYKGKQLFANSCAKCHVLFGEGGRIGPDLTTFKRDDWLNMLINVVNPSAEIREGFEQVMVVTRDGRAVSGLRFDQDQQVLVLRGVDGQNITVARRDIEETIPQPKSLMPEGLLNGLQDQEIRDLFAYLRSSQPLSARGK
ncbi:MAG TPA: PVC-type heme-binding CxxCH protein [Planctomycetaceae bacterium]|nr:PVC-type heme-binding CxxCH protein [Planctomycetaceae bacterium]